MMVRPGLEVREVDIELAEEIGQGLREQRKGCFRKAWPGSFEVGCTNTDDSCLELMYNVDIATVVDIVMEVQIPAKGSFQEMVPEGVEIDIEIAAVNSTVVIVHESAVAEHRRKVEVAMEFLEVHSNLLDSPALVEPIESSPF